MKCRFCGQTWHTKGRRGTSRKFSWQAVCFWLFWVALIALCVWKFDLIRNKALEYTGNVIPPKPAQVVEETPEEEEIPEVVSPFVGTSSQDDVDSQFDPTFDATFDSDSSEDVAEP